MNFSEALKQGYVFTGAAWSNCSRDTGDKYKELARKLKLKYKVNYKIVTGSKDSWLSIGSKAIVGDENFNKLWEIIIVRKSEQQLKTIPDRIKKAEAKYKAELKAIEQLKESLQEDIEFIKSLRKLK